MRGPSWATWAFRSSTRPKELDTKLTELFTTHAQHLHAACFCCFWGWPSWRRASSRRPSSCITEKPHPHHPHGRERAAGPYRSSDDEIGLLVREYNAMLGKLEASQPRAGRPGKRSGLARNGPPGGPRNQEPAHADEAQPAIFAEGHRRAPPQRRGADRPHFSQTPALRRWTC
ncbi:MAG: hypothetical protein WKG07_29280 [Hymenobacter sp.]